MNNRARLERLAESERQRATGCEVVPQALKIDWALAPAPPVVHENDSSANLSAHAEIMLSLICNRPAKVTITKSPILNGTAL